MPLATELWFHQCQLPSALSAMLTMSSIHLLHCVCVLLMNGAMPTLRSKLQHGYFCCALSCAPTLDNLQSQVHNMLMTAPVS